MQNPLPLSKQRAVAWAPKRRGTHYIAAGPRHCRPVVKIVLSATAIAGQLTSGLESEADAGRRPVPDSKKAGRKPASLASETLNAADTSTVGKASIEFNAAADRGTLTSYPEEPSTRCQRLMTNR
ncbi:hypothetical protein [Kumtagia ephedrae]|uniref:hypothetical protein n=1 Tax=Kumtagia ephedrae TaxID=2116701 RepID=UPI0010572370|nr:hypothetical protein [Mesorhizobium ephedrae]